MKDETEKTENSLISRSVLLEYWETCDARQGGVIVNINEKALCIHSHVNMYIGGKLRIKVFFSLGYEFDEFQILAKIVGKTFCCDGGWEAYEYELEIINTSGEDRLKLRDLLKIRQAKTIYS